MSEIGFIGMFWTKGIVLSCIGEAVLFLRSLFAVVLKANETGGKNVHKK